MAPRDVGPERERERSRSRHRERSAETRSRRRDGESERDRHRRKRDRHRRDAVGRGEEDTAEPAVLAGDEPLIGNALGIQPGSLHPSQGLYASVAPPVTSTSGSARHHNSYPSTSRVGGSPSTPPATGHETAPAIVTTVSISGSRHREVLQNHSAAASHTHRFDPGSRWADPVSRPSSTPTGPLLSSWVAPDLTNPSLNTLGLSAPAQDASGVNSQTFPVVSSSIALTTRDSVSSWGTEDSGPTQGDLFSTLRPLASAPADGDLPVGDLFPGLHGSLYPDCESKTTARACFNARSRHRHPITLSSLPPFAFPDCIRLTNIVCF
ncbi:hypothetical protein B0F90DRAFT_427711 [Multifurca ochricompacta]|uniref:Uncharacterized protein n=1 Tax=Multifurca ochricompacta TaxID=376703 RepID=A0AAD4QM20_9AGAM|nr:hypothetical protein B0F90DRAFT_427711 [Multifurca ochricompacta]